LSVTQQSITGAGVYFYFSHLLSGASIHVANTCCLERAFAREAGAILKYQLCIFFSQFLFLDGTE
jgi:hypothetical protein